MNGTATFGRKQHPGGRLHRNMAVHQWACGTTIPHHGAADLRWLTALAEMPADSQLAGDALVAAATTNDLGMVITAQEFWNHSSVCSASVWNCLKTGFFLLLPAVVFNIDGPAHRGAFPLS